MKKFDIFGGMRSEHFNLHVIQDVELESIEEALKWAEDFAHDLYYLNPNRDVLEIMAQQNIDEDTALMIFMKEMFNDVIFYVEEIVEINGEVIERIRHVSI